MLVRSKSNEPDELLRTLGALVRASRRRKGLTQQQLAKLADVDRSYIIGIEQGRRNVSIDIISRLARSCGVTVEISFLPNPEDVQPGRCPTADAGSGEPVSP